MLRRLALFALIPLLCATEIACQVLDDALVPRGRARVEITPIFTSWESRFGRSGPGATGRELLGEDLTSSAAASLFPGAESLRAAVAAMSGASGYTAVLGETQARVTKDITRVEFGGHIGVFDWLTIGAVLPVTRTRASVDVAFRPDTIGGDLGHNPIRTNAIGVTSFLQALAAADVAAQANATQVCASSPGSGACTSAQALAARTTAFSGSAQTAYSASAFFPIAGSATQVSLSQAVTSLSADLISAGLGGIAPPMIFANAWVTEPEFWSLPLSSASGVQGMPLASVKAPWDTGDLEVTATVRFLERGARDSTGAATGITHRVLGTFLARLPTGVVDDPDVFLDVGTGDGQADLEGRLSWQMTLGRHVGLQLGGRYGVQRPRTLVRRVATPETVLAPLSTRHVVKWSPGPYFGVEVAPALRISDDLTLAGEYRAFRKYRDAYELTGASVGAGVDPSVLELESGVTLHQVGGAVHYDTLVRGLRPGVRPMQVRFRVLRAVAGGGGQTPVTTQVELGVRLFRRIWGPS